MCVGARWIAVCHRTQHFPSSYAAVPTSLQAMTSTGYETVSGCFSECSFGRTVWQLNFKCADRASAYTCPEGDLELSGQG